MLMSYFQDIKLYLIAFNLTDTLCRVVGLRVPASLPLVVCDHADKFIVEDLEVCLHQRVRVRAEGGRTDLLLTEDLGPPPPVYVQDPSLVRELVQLLNITALTILRQPADDT